MVSTEQARGRGHKLGFVPKVMVKKKIKTLSTESSDKEYLLWSKLLSSKVEAETALRGWVGWMWEGIRRLQGSRIGEKLGCCGMLSRGGVSVKQERYDDLRKVYFSSLEAGISSQNVVVCADC